MAKKKEPKVKRVVKIRGQSGNAFIDAVAYSAAREITDKYNLGISPEQFSAYIDKDKVREIGEGIEAAKEYRGITEKKNVKKERKEEKESFMNVLRSIFPHYDPKYANAAASIMAVFGIALIFLFNPSNFTGAAVGIGNLENNNILFFIGLGLLIISGISFIFRGGKYGKEKNKSKK